MKAMLTSAGLETQRLRKEFWRLCEKPAKDLRCLFVPTAAIDAPSLAVLRKCFYDLLNAGCKKENIVVFDCHEPITADELAGYDVVYVTGGETYHLAREMKKVGLMDALTPWCEAGGLYLGVSAGAILCTTGFAPGLPWADCELHVHQSTGDAPGPLTAGVVKLTNAQMILIDGAEPTVF